MEGTERAIRKIVRCGGQAEPVWIVIDDMDEFLADGSAFEEDLCHIMPDARSAGMFQQKESGLWERSK